MRSAWRSHRREPSTAVTSAPASRTADSSPRLIPENVETEKGGPGATPTTRGSMSVGVVEQHGLLRSARHARVADYAVEGPPRRAGRRAAALRLVAGEGR